MRKLRGFTLVELLVVIGIIALLISILLPSLAKARQYAVNISCQSNLRSIGQGLLFYANDHKGKLPGADNGGWNTLWPCQVTDYLGQQMIEVPNNQYGNVMGTYTAVCRCPEAPIEGSDVAWNGGFHYTCNVRAMHSSTQNDGIHPKDPTNLGLGYNYCVVYPLACPDSASKMLMWDGPILTDGAPWGTATGPWIACPNNVPQSWWFITWGYANPNSWVNWWADPTVPGGFNMDAVVSPSQDNSYNNLNPTNAKWIGIVNRDGGPGDAPWSGNTMGYQRYRHLGNTSCNFLFFDGHVEARKIGTVTYRDLSIYPY
jgi:prepilin-type N-terminal cleavage/methylation domain-containing protein/prepilin-type processing-associated H-X9-DG protein